ncbi:glycosyltransferase WbuB [Paenibacillus sp. H1-7]|uniref:glycosyltransferase family 4 protein n=1 Tax=Paenibacillus sp. H1-7 TaxID=2282849 RepID=UPI001EF7BBA3|nr:glycosyltransferase family 4 protein [Paenibacillus sp. H1-7]ULL20123.1 glycosyltransferase WbuB [Paenibacillus sp. H1-7]
MKKDVLIMCQYFYPEYVSSATLPTELAEDLVKKGLSVDVLCGYPKEYYHGDKVPLREELNGYTVRRVKYTEFNNKTKIGRIINFFSFFTAILSKTLSLLNYRSILVYSNPPILPLVPCLISKITKTKFIFVAFDVYPDNALILGAIKKGGIIERLMRYINTKVYQHATKIVALGSEMKSYMINTNIAPDCTNIEVIPNWYNDKKIGKTSKIHNKEFKELNERWPFVVLYSGNMGTAQDMDTILQCISNLKNRNDVFFLFTGHGNKADYVKQYFLTNNINNAKVYGFLLGEDYNDVLKIADVCLVSLAVGIEGVGVPSKTYGYLAAGKPVISIMSSETDIAKHLETFSAGGNVKQGDSTGLERLVLNYMENKEHTSAHGVNARMVFEKFYQREICTNMYYNLIKIIIS